MAVSTVDAYGAPAYGPLKGIQGVVFHTPENVNHTLAQAIAIAKWQATSGNTSGGSYHGILGYDAARGAMTDPNAWVMVRSVMWSQIAGGLSTRRDAVWAPQRFPWIKQMLSAAAFADPNAYLHQISLSGKAAWYVSGGFPKGLLIRVAEWLIVLETAYKYDAVLMLHRHFQTDRTDPGPLTFPDQVLVEYHKLKSGVTPPSIDLAAEVKRLTTELAKQTTRLGTKNAHFDVAGANVRALEQAFDEGLVKLRATLAAGRKV